jgi:ribosomal protein S18 acetylase RimI-like enzyme
MTGDVDADSGAAVIHHGVSAGAAENATFHSNQQPERRVPDSLRFCMYATACPQKDRTLTISPFSIREATPADVPVILAMILELAEFERLTHLCIATESDLEKALFTPPTRAEVLIGIDAGFPACFALFFHNFSTFLGKPGLYLEDLFVRPEYRRRGYGRAMLVRLARLAVQRGCGRFEWSVLDWNEAAIRFYQSLGATVLPDWRITRVTGPALETLATSDAG